jgi:glutamine amidotransferase
MIAVIDYDDTNAHAVKQALEAVGASADLVKAQAPIERANKVIFPNCSSFETMIRSVRDGALVRPLFTAIDRGIPVLGIGMGMHLLFDVSYENGQHTGLGVVPGKTTGFDLGTHPAAASFGPTHRGWSPVSWQRDCPLLAGLGSGESFYFDHSFYADPLDSAVMCATCNRGIDFSAMIWQGRLFGTQFLPEKSEKAGQVVLKNFVRM